MDKAESKLIQVRECTRHAFLSLLSDVDHPDSNFRRKSHPSLSLGRYTIRSLDPTYEEEVHRPYLYQNQPHETRTSSRLIVSIQNISAKFSSQ